MMSFIIISFTHGSYSINVYYKCATCVSISFNAMMLYVIRQNKFDLMIIISALVFQHNFGLKDSLQEPLLLFMHANVSIKKGRHFSGKGPQPISSSINLYEY